MLTFLPGLARPIDQEPQSATASCSRVAAMVAVIETLLRLPELVCLQGRRPSRGAFERGWWREVSVDVVCANTFAKSWAAVRSVSKQKRETNLWRVVAKTTSASAAAARDALLWKKNVWERWLLL